jgi:hypothetical protein
LSVSLSEAISEKLLLLLRVVLTPFKSFSDHKVKPEIANKRYYKIEEESAKKAFTCSIRSHQSSKFKTNKKKSISIDEI